MDTENDPYKRSEAYTLATQLARNITNTPNFQELPDADLYEWLETWGYYWNGRMWHTTYLRNEDRDD